MTHPTYSIIIITKDRIEHLKRLVTSIEENTTDYELIIVNDASTDGTTEWLAKQHARYSQYKGSQGYQSISYTESIPVATAWNLGAEVARGEFIQILNDDMEVTKGWLDEQRKLYDLLTARGNDVGVLASKLLRGDEILSMGGAFRGTNLIPVPGPDVVKAVDYSNFPFCKRSLWKEVGGFTPCDWIYYEDADFGLLLQSKGYTNYYNPLCVMRHETLGFKKEDGEEQYNRRQHNESVLQQRSREKFMERWRDYLLTKHLNLY